MKKQKKRLKAKTSTLPKKPQWKLGMFRGKIEISDDFNAPLPDEILDAFEGVKERKENNRRSK